MAHTHVHKESHTDGSSGSVCGLLEEQGRGGYPKSERCPGRSVPPVIMGNKIRKLEKMRKATRYVRDIFITRLLDRYTYVGDFSPTFVRRT